MPTIRTEPRYRLRRFRGRLVDADLMCKPAYTGPDVASIRHEVRMRTSLSKLYECLSTESGIGSWWDKPTAVRLGGDLFWEFRPGAGHGVLRMKVFPPVPNERVEWECVSTHAADSPASAWTNTLVTFAFSQSGDFVVLEFRHDGWDENNRFYAFCNFQWAVALEKLKRACETQSQS